MNLDHPAIIKTNSVVLRRRILALLRGYGDRKVVVIQAPAGFGKTTLLRQYCDLWVAEGGHVAWARMDARAADPSEFIRILVQAVESLVEPICDDEAKRPFASMDEASVLLQRIKAPALIVIDNFETMGGVLESVFGQIVRLLPDGVQLCVGSRIIPTSRLSRMLIEEISVVLSERELRFTLSESTEFFRDYSWLNANEIHMLHERTDGWPAALQCFRLRLQRNHSRQTMITAGGGITPELMDFLASEVFEGLDDALQRLLLKLCLPEKLSADLVKHLTDIDDGAECLADIERKGLFLTPIDLERKWYRFHSLFRHVLLARARSIESETEMRKRHLEIARWYLAKGMTEEAFVHFLEEGDVASAAAVLNEVIGRLIADERLESAQQYIQQIPLDTMLRYESLLSSAIITFGFRRVFDKANRLLDDGFRLYSGNARVRADLNYAKLFVLAARDDIDEMGKAALVSLSELSPQDGHKYAVACNARALFLVGRGRPDEARELLLRARPLHDEDDHRFGQAYQEAIFGSILSGQNRVSDAIRSLSAALQHMGGNAGGGFTAGSVVAAYLAEALYEQNRIAAAEALIHDYRQLAEEQAVADPLAVMLLTMARIAHLRGDEGEAEEVLERLLYLGYRHSLPRLVCYAKAEFVRMATLGGDLDKAERRFRELDADNEAVLSEEVMFHAGETEARSVTEARYLIHTGRCAAARTLLQAHIREARSQNRRRRELKLTLMLALAQQAEGQTSSARRSCLEALRLGGEQEFIRSFLDEKHQALRLLKDLQGSLRRRADEADGASPNRYLERLLKEAGEVSPGRTVTCERAPFPAELIEQLTSRERVLLGHVAHGMSNKELAEHMSVSTNTIKYHLRNIFDKLQIHNRVQAVWVARQIGLID